MRDTAVVFHWWCDNPNTKPFEDAANPVVLSAASIRKNNSEVPIYVVDVSDCKRPDSDWRHFPYKYGFKVFKRDSFLGEMIGKFGRMFNLRLMSRVWDVELAMRDVPESNIVFMDTDIFAIAPLWPAGTNRPEHFYANYNNGVWFYNKRARSTKFIFDFWKGMICRAMHDTDFRHEIYERNPNYGTFYMQDEIVYRCLAQMMPNHIRPIEMEQNYLFQWLALDPPEVTSKIRGLHCLSFITGTNRLKLFLSIKELWDQVASGFDEHDYKMIFGDAQPLDRMSIADFYGSQKNLNRLYRALGILGKESNTFDHMVKIMTENGRIHLPIL